MTPTLTGSGPTVRGNAMAEPSTKEIAELCTALEEEWGPFAPVDKLRTDFYLGRHQIEVPDLKILGLEPEVVTANTGMEVIRRLKGLFGYGELQVDPAGVGADPRRDAETFARWLNALFPCLEDMTQEDTWDLVKEDVLRLGRAWTLTLPLFKRYTVDAGYPDRKDYKTDKAFNKGRGEWLELQKPPISHRHMPATQVRALLTGDVGVERGVVVTEVSGSRIKRLWPGSAIATKIGEDKAELAKKFRIVTYVDDTYCCYAYTGEEGRHIGPVTWGQIQGEMLDSWPHKMGVCPLVLHVGQLTSESALVDRFRCVIDDILGIGVAGDRLLSRQLMQVKVDGLNLMYIETKDSMKEDRTFKLNMDGPTVFFEGEKPGRFEPSPTHPEAESLYAKLMTHKERLALTDAMRGIGGADQSGISYKLMRDAAQSEWTPMGGHMADGRRRQAQMCARAVMALGEPVYVRESTKDKTERVGATPELVKDRLEDIHIMLNPEFPEDRAGDLDAVQKAVNLGLSLAWGLENIMQLAEPQKAIDEGIAEKVVMAASDQLVQSALEQLALKRQQAQGMTPLDVEKAIPNASEGLAAYLQGMGQPPAPVGAGAVPGGVGGVPQGAPPNV